MEAIEEQAQWWGGGQVQLHEVERFFVLMEDLLDAFDFQAIFKE